MREAEKFGMRVERDSNRNYILFLEPEKEDLRQLKQGPLEAMLTSAEGEDLGKKAILAFAPDSGAPRATLQYLPPGTDEATAKEVRISLNSEGLTQIETEGDLISRYEHGRIGVVNGLPRGTRFF